YYGNEIYAFDLNSLTVSRLTNPGLPLTTSGPCVETLVNGTQPNSRHTHDGVAYISNKDRLFVFGGSLSPCGSFSAGTWTYSFVSNQWEQRNPTGQIPHADPGVVTSYDPNTGKVFLHDSASLYVYDFDSNSYTKLGADQGIDYHMTGVIDPVRKKFLILGAGQAWIVDIGAGSSYTLQALASTGGSALINSDYPGLA